MNGTCADKFPLDAERARQLLMSLPEALILLDGEGRVQCLNPQAEQLLGLCAETACGRHWTRCMDLHEANGERRHATLLARPQDGAAAEAHYVLTRLDGTQRVVQVEAVEGAAAVLLRDCTVGYQRLRRLEHECAVDHLTNLVNRREFERRLATLVARAREEGSRHVLLFMDLDHFKRVNDAFGHPAGDALLRQVAETLRAAVRERDTLARLGGDEFGLLMEHCLPAEGLRAANTLRLLLRNRRFAWRGERLDFGISIGLAAIDRHSAGAEAVWAQADAACYKAKRGGSGAQLSHRPPRPGAHPGRPRLSHVGNRSGRRALER